MHTYSGCINDIRSFYASLGKLDFKSVTTERISELKILADKLNYDLNRQYENLSSFERYVKVINRIKTNPRTYTLNNSTEKVLLFMFAVDSNLEATIIYGESNTTTELKQKMKLYFGIYDSNLIKIEKNYIKNFLNENEKEDINNKIDGRIFKY